MLSMNLKRKVAVLLTGVMVLGMSVTAFAAPAGSQTGTGSFEGHVEREVIAVDLPTVKTGATPFAYTLDPEGLIKETKAVAYGGEDKFKEGSLGNNVYFLNEDGKYDNKSQSYTVSNNSSVSLNVAVKVTLPAAVTGDVAFVENESDLVDGTKPEDAKLYLYLDVDGEKQPLKAGETVSLNKVLNDGSAFYYVSQNSTAPAGSVHGYDFVISQNKVDEAQGDVWDDVAFKLVGKANKVTDGHGVKAPTLTVTWEYAKYVAPVAPPAPTTYTVTKVFNDGSTADEEVTVDVGETFAKPADPTYAGHTFKGWFTAATGGTEVTFPLTEAATIHAQWYENVTGHGVWSGDWSKIWVGANENDGFESDSVTVEVSADGTDYVELTAFTLGDDGWVQIVWSDVVAKLGTEPAKAYVRVYDGNKLYSWHD